MRRGDWSGKMKIENQSIPINKMHDFHQILCETGGRYLQNPYFSISENQYRVSYEPGNYKKMNERLQRVSIDIVEVRKDQWWRKMLRRYLKIKC